MNEPLQPSSSPWRSKTFWLACLLALFTLFLFWPVHRFAFVFFDDPDYVSANPHVLTGLTSKNVAWAFQQSHAANWHPLTWLSHMTDAQLFGKGPQAPHLVNLLLHITNSVLLFVIFLRWTSTLWPSTLLATLFALHPLHVESVAWIAERKDVLSAFFFLLTLLAYTAYAAGSKPQAARTSQTSDFTKKLRPGSYVLALFFFSLGLLSKPMVITLPFLLLLLDFWPLCRFRTSRLILGPVSAHPDPRQSDHRYDWNLILEKIPFFLLSTASACITFFAQKHGGAVQSLTNTPLVLRLENALVSYPRYLLKTFWPASLATPYPPADHWPLIIVSLSLIFLVAVSGLCWRFRLKFPYLLTGWLWFLGMLVPVIGLVKVGEQSIADRYMYLPSIGVFILFLWGTQDLIRHFRIPALGLQVAAAIMLFLLAFRTHNQLQFWQNSETLFRHAIAVTHNNWAAYYNLGWFLDNQGRLDEALACYRKALQIEPRIPEPLNNIGYVLAAKGQYAEAVPYFQQALKAEPGFVEGHYNLGKALEKLGRVQEAKNEFKQVLNARPDHLGTLNNLADGMSARGQYVEALPYYQTSLKGDPNQPITHYNYANALARLKRTSEAIEQYRLALKNKPDYPEAHHDLGIALGREGKFDEAISHLEQAVRQNPSDPQMQASLGKALAVKGNLPGAITRFEGSLRLRPENPQIHYSLAHALASVGKFEEAKKHYQEALRLSPGFLPAAQELQTLTANSQKQAPP
jgi:tetratricopeptide (TPR) repeat protein